MIIISPYSRLLKNGKENPKNFPNWSKVISSLTLRGIEVVQVGSRGEVRIEGTSDFRVGLPLNELATLVNQSQTWASVDNFFPHLCALQSTICGVVVFGPSDPLIFGYPQFVNLVRREFLRKDQFKPWEDCEFNPDAFVDPGQVIDSIVQLV